MFTVELVPLASVNNTTSLAHIDAISSIWLVCNNLEIVMDFIPCIVVQSGHAA